MKTMDSFFMIRRFDVYSTLLTSYTLIFLAGMATGAVKNQPALTRRMLQEEIYPSQALERTIQDGLEFSAYQMRDLVNFE